MKKNMENKMTNFQTQQKKFCAENFGNEYIERNSDVANISSNLAIFAKRRGIATPPGWVDHD